ncbi:hypothetical protein OSSY52_09450 [Tepiditoga spiralis]|uniref:ABC transporter substrate-binding protein PnrA-like domain-containing protein n=1 Tax=Tepiditoga spiralis TaxID=2108365 RepID=A0A7G1G6N9_9BACT|nr:BMP family ABC transporter substrate-binding protein [Tepiditoga spiralis]BBE30804.1 hypothetical protein OSSY52_09450 [Tepiditoga spiralis]
MLYDRNKSIEDYEKALKLGKKEFLKSVSSAKGGYLNSLEEIIENAEILSEKNLGTIEIPLKKVIGTYYHSRSLSFSQNFYPLIERDTEFSSKWCNLLEIQYNEGIRDAIEVYEYLNWFYVVEGNKRVSVLKYLKAPTIMGNVKRIIPTYDKNDIEIKIYYSFLDFYEKTHINSIWFSKPKSFEILYDYMQEYKPESYIDLLDFEIYKSFLYEIYEPFRKIYKTFESSNNTVTTGDSFLKYLEEFGVSELNDEKELKKRVKKIIREMNYTEKTKQPSLLIPAFFNEEKLKVAFIYNSDIKESAWTYSHNLGRKYIEEKYKNQIITRRFEGITSTEEYEKLLKKLERENYSVIFSTSFDFILDEKLSKFHNVKFMYFSGYQTDKNVNTYFGRMYEPRFLSGIIAGSMTKSNKIGYVAPFGIPEVIMGIDAFALGVKTVNSNAIVNVGWTNEWHNKKYEKDVVKYLIKDKNCDVLSHHQDSTTVVEEGEKYGVYTIGYHHNMKKYAPNTMLTSVVWNWGIYYEKIIQNILKGSTFSFLDLFGNNKGIRKFWGGMDSGVVDIVTPSKLVNPQIKNLMKLLKASIINDDFQIFKGPIYDIDGTLKIKENLVIDDDELFEIDWFIDNIRLD